MTTVKSAALGLCGALLFSIHLRAQTPESPQARLRALGAVEAPGAVPVFFVPAAKERAMRLQQSIQASHSWYEKQFQIRVPIVLAVVDAEMDRKLSDLITSRQIPTQENPRLIAVRDQIAGAGPPGADTEHAGGGILQGEHILFHDDGHAFFDALQLGDIGAADQKLTAYNRSLVELIASIFEITYMRAQRPDMKFFLEDRRTHPQTPRRYSTLADFDYLNGIDNVTYFWFMFRLETIADALLTKHPDFVESINKVKAVFHDQAHSVPPEEVTARLERIWPGFTDIAGATVGASTIAAVTPTACPEPVKSSTGTRVVIRNDSADSVTVLSPSSASLVPQYSWRTLQIVVGASLTLPDRTCLVGQKEPGLFVIGKH